MRWRSSARLHFHPPEIPMTALLAGVRSADEAFDAVEAGAELIDLKEPSSGALRGVAPGVIVRIAQQLRGRYPRAGFRETPPRSNRGGPEGGGLLKGRRKGGQRRGSRSTSLSVASCR